MLTNQAQEKIITALLKRPQNQFCSDCNCKTPCWASLDFGVFVCMNCSGAHRALGPSITRVKSTKLDIWNKDWVENMKIGNSILNIFWEHELSSHPSNIKPNVNSSLNDIKKFVHDKYVKRKFVDPNEDFDPLTKVKKGISIEKPEKDNGNAKPNNVIDTNPVKPTAPGLKETPKKNQYHTVKESTLNFNKQDPFKKHSQQNPKVKENKNTDIDLLNFHQQDGPNQKPVDNQANQSKNFDFNFEEIQVQKPKQPQLNDSKGNPMGFDSFLQNVSNNSESSNSRPYQQHQQPMHGNYFISPQGFVNSQNPSHYPHHGYSLPSHHTQQPQVTMNINMNMYPNVMNINMGTIPTYPNGPQIVQPSNQVKQFQYNDFFTGNISPPPQTQNITLEVTLNQKDEQKGSKDKSWVDDWM